jgi:uncharacterized protein YodC (DUF2158 family)
MSQIQQKIGSVVKLVSCGPSMTFVEVHAWKLRCVWYDAGGGMQTAWYPVDALIPAPKVGG